MRHYLALAILLAMQVRVLALTDEQRQVPLERDALDPTATKVVLLAGSISNKPGQHEYFAGCVLMMNWLRSHPGVFPVLAAEGWPQNEKILEGAKCVVIYMDGGSKLSFLPPARWSIIEGLMAKGAGLVMLHQAVDVPADRAAQVQAWLGGVYQGDIGCRGHWDMEFAQFPRHPITRGVTPFAAPLDGWLYNLKFAPGAVSLAAGAVPDKSRTTADAKAHAGRDEVIGWAFERVGGGRSFGFTGCDLHRNWGVESQRRFVVNGILWASGLDVPATGARVDLAPEDLTRWLDDKPKPAPKAPKTAPNPEPAAAAQ